MSPAPAPRRGPQLVLMAGLPCRVLHLLETCPFSHPWPSLGIQGPPGKGSAILPLRTQRDASMFFVAAGTEHRPGLPLVPRAVLRPSRTRHTCTAVEP